MREGERGRERGRGRGEEGEREVLTWTAMSSGLLEEERTPTQRAKALCRDCGGDDHVSLSVTSHTHSERFRAQTHHNTILSAQLLCVEGTGVHGMKGHLTGSREDWSRLGEELIVVGLSLNSGDQHWVASILVWLQHCRGHRGRSSATHSDTGMEIYLHCSV